jgi:hypothetical protein
MRRVVFCLCVVALTAAWVPTTALTKGPSEATITGPGLAEPIELRSIAEEAGFFAAVFGHGGSPLLAERPTGTLGPRYTITYVMPGPDNRESELVQDLYPYAKPHPVTYTEPGQTLWTTERTRGGWYVTYGSSLKEQLVAAGLPSTPPTGGAGDGFPWVLAGTLVALAATLGLVVLAVLHGRRRPDTATA